MKRINYVFIAISIASFLVIQYLILDSWNQSTQKKMDEFFQSGYEEGLFESVKTIYQQTDNCQIAIINIGNNTKQLLDVYCLQVIELPP